jgi:hypothetical protein
MDHYDLLARPDWTAKSVLIVSPYVERKFFKRIVQELRPATLAVVIDDGCRPEDLTMILALARQRTRICVALGSARGLVHAKIFHIEWLTPGGQCRHTFVYGSGNATRQAFNSNINSEVMCKVGLTAANHAPILDWAAHVFTAATTGSPGRVISRVHDARLANGINIRLPEMTIKQAGNKANNFDLWLQRGRLLSAFRPDPSFLRVQVTFVESFARQIHLEWLKKGSQSLIFQQIYKALDDVDDDAFDDPRELVKLLRSKWNTTIEADDGEEISVGEYIDRYDDHG